MDTIRWLELSLLVLVIVIGFLLVVKGHILQGLVMIFFGAFAFGYIYTVKEQKSKDESE